MEELMPEYNETIIVGVFYKDNFNWYVTEKEIWFLDYQKRINAFKKRGFEVKEEYIEEERKNILVLNGETADLFLKRIEKYKIEVEHLRELLKQKRTLKDNSWDYDFRPSLYVNFDTCELFSWYSEPASFEEYVPSNWKGAYRDFMDIIPADMKYWMDKKTDLLKQEEL